MYWQYLPIFGVLVSSKNCLIFPVATANTLSSQSNWCYRVKYPVGLPIHSSTNSRPLALKKLPVWNLEVLEACMMG